MVWVESYLKRLRRTGTGREILNLPVPQNPQIARHADADALEGIRDLGAGIEDRFAQVSGIIRRFQAAS